MRRVLLVAMLLALSPAPGRAQTPAPWPEVNVANANVVLARQELRLYWAGPAFEVRRTYNSRLHAAGPLGFGWRLGYTRAVKAGAAVAVEEDDGRLTRYRQESGGKKGAASFVPQGPAPAHALSRLASGAWRRVHGDTVEDFDAAGRLTRVADGNGMAIDVAQAGGPVRALTDSTGRALRFTSDASGRVTAIADPLGRSIALAYDRAGNLAQVTDVLGGVTAYAYDDAHRITRITYPGGEVVKLAYDPATDWVRALELPGGRKLAYAFVVDPADKTKHTVTVTDEAGRRTVHRFARSGAEAEVTGPLGEVTKQERCEECGGYVTMRNALGGTLEHVHAPDGLTFTAKDAAGAVETVRYEAKRRKIVSRVDRTGATTTFGYDERGNLVSATDACNGKSGCSRDERGFAKELVRADGTRLPLAASPLGLPTSVKDGLGGLTKIEYDPAGRPRKVVDAEGRELSIEYNEADQATILTDSGGQRKEVKYDQSGRVTAEVDRSGHRTQYFYDADGRVARVQQPSGAETRFTYDAHGDVTRVVRAASSAVEEGTPSFSIEYDAARRPVALTDPNNDRVKVEYDAAGNATKVTDPAGGVTSSTYDAASRLTARTDPSGRTWKFAYDGEGRLRQLTLPGGQSVLGVYDPMGRLLSLKEPAGRTSAYRYNALGKLASAAGPEASPTTFTYDADGRCTSALDPVLGKVEYAYTATGRLAQVKMSAGRWLKVTYDDASRTRRVETSAGQKVETQLDWDGRRLEESAPGYHLRWSYTEDGLLHDVTDVPSGRVQRYDYDAIGNRARWIDPEGRVTDYKYDLAGRLVEIAAPERIAATMKLTYDAAGRRASRELDMGVVTRYRHDAAGRLVELTHAFKDKPLARYALEYDANGVVKRLEDDGRALAFAPDDAGRLPAGAPARAAYDATGSVASEPRTTGPAATSYRYDGFTRLAGATLSTGDEVKIAYGPDLRFTGYAGPRETRELVYETDAIVAERDRTHVLAEYFLGPGVDEPVLMRRDGKPYALLCDHLGSVRKIVDASGAVVREVTYSLHGAVERERGAPSCAFGFTGRPFEPHSGLVNLRLRWLNPRLGRFQTLDPLVATSRYDYASGNPVTHTDPLGAAVDAWMTGGPFAASAGLAALSAAPALSAAAGTGAAARFASLAGGPTSAPEITRSFVGAAAGRAIGASLPGARVEPIPVRTPGIAPPSGAIAQALARVAASPDRTLSERTLLSASTGVLWRGVFVGGGRLIAQRIIDSVGAPGPLADEIAPGVPEVLEDALREIALSHVTPARPETGARDCRHGR